MRLKQVVLKQIKVNLNALKSGNHPFIDPIKIFRHHYGDDAFDILGKYIDKISFCNCQV